MKLSFLRLIPGWVLMITAFLYVRKMKGCDCTDPKIVNNLYNFELFFMSFSVISITLLSAFDTKKLISKSLPFITLALTANYAYFAALAYFVYLVYEFYINVGNCKCADDQMKYALYIQGGLYSMLVGAAAVITVWHVLRRRG